MRDGVSGRVISHSCSVISISCQVRDLESGGVISQNCREKHEVRGGVISHSFKVRYGESGQSLL